MRKNREAAAAKAAASGGAPVETAPVKKWGTVGSASTSSVPTATKPVTAGLVKSASVSVSTPSQQFTSSNPISRVQSVHVTSNVTTPLNSARANAYKPPDKPFAEMTTEERLEIIFCSPIFDS